MEIIVKTTNKGCRDFLTEKVKPELSLILSGLSRAYKFRLPRYLYLLPYRRPSKRGCINCHIGCKTSVLTESCAYGRSGTGMKYDLYVSLNIPACLRNGELKSTIVHEAAHIAEKCATGRWSHGGLFEKMMKTARKAGKEVGHESP
jgi:hypothetical protein